MSAKYIPIMSEETFHTYNTPKLNVVVIIYIDYGLYIEILNSVYYI